MNFDQQGLFLNYPMFDFLVISLFLALFSLTEPAAEPVFPIQKCSSTTTFTPNSTYRTNINTLLSSFTSNSSANPTGFLSISVGQSPVVVYGLFLYRGDVARASCHACIETGSKELKKRCPVEKESVIYYDECMLRYSDRNFFSTITQEQQHALLNREDVSEVEPDSFMSLVMKTMTVTASKAADDHSGKKFDTGNATFLNSERLYTWAQCTPDLSIGDSRMCLEVAITGLPSCCDGKRGGLVLTPTCNVSFELNTLYNGLNEVSPPLPIEALRPLRSEGNSGISSITIVAIVLPVGVLSLLTVMICFFRRRSSRKRHNTRLRNSVITAITTVESLQFDLATIEDATDKFPDANKLGEGGIGIIYKGRLPNGKQIAVKRLSRSSGQGAQEFKNEVIFVAKLQHKNLVTLLGYCCRGEEKILIYEFVPNKSLNYFLFDLENRGRLDWSRRYKIIIGIARGILYLHKDSRLKIIHHDLKPSDILLDVDMNPKISDFGMTRLFRVDQTQGNASRIVGTYGYMSPEYVMHGQFSVKSDMYSFGVLILEIISGKKNSSFYQPENAGEDLLSYASIKHTGMETLERQNALRISRFNLDKFLFKRGSHNMHQSRIVVCSAAYFPLHIFDQNPTVASQPPWEIVGEF